jgi:hypothetical protein
MIYLISFRLIRRNITSFMLRRFGAGDNRKFGSFHTQSPITDGNVVTWVARCRAGLDADAHAFIRVPGNTGSNHKTEVRKLTNDERGMEQLIRPTERSFLTASGNSRLSTRERLLPVCENLAAKVPTNLCTAANTP